MATTERAATRVDPAVGLAFSDRALGNISLAVGEPDADARTRLSTEVGVEVGDLVFMRQVHGAAVAVVGGQDRGRGVHDHGDAIADVDALVTFDQGVALVVQVADCVPVLLIDPNRSVAAVHAGRGGVVDGVVEAALAVMDPVDPREVHAVLGPAIGGCCYEVEPDLAAQVAGRIPAARATTTWGTASLDLPNAVEAQLQSLGVEQVQRVGGCTRCSTQWFSHRRQPGEGRHAGIVVRGGRHG